MELNGQLLINNRWVEGDGPLIQSVNPATNIPLWKGNEASLIQIQDAIINSQTAFKTWKKTSLKERIDLVNRFSSIVERHQKNLTLLISKETGKPLWESSQEIKAVIHKAAASIASYEERCKEINRESDSQRLICRHMPHGSVAVLGPFNFPAHLPNGHIIPALLAGNTILFKPSEQAPATAEAIMRCWIEAEIPPGIIQLIQGSRSVGEALVQHQDIKGLYFTGSYPIGKKIAHYSIDIPDRIVALEMGGNNPLIIGDITDIEAACYTIIQSAYITAGQRCSCARRLIVVNSSNSAQLIETLIHKVNSIRIGSYDTDPEPFMGPVISNQVVQQLLSSQHQLIQQGGKLLKEMKLLSQGGAFLSPGLIDMTQADTNSDEEFFGPLLQLYRVDSLQQAIHIANQTSYGLSASILSNSKKEYLEVLDQIRAGIINWNAPTTGASSLLPFGGIGKSGNYRPSAYYAADYCAYPVASTELEHIQLPSQLLPGLT